MDVDPTTQQQADDEDTLHTPDLAKKGDGFIGTMRQFTSLVHVVDEYRSRPRRTALSANEMDLLVLLQRASLSVSVHLMYNSDSADLLAATRSSDLQVRAHVARVIERNVRFCLGCLSDLGEEVREAYDAVVDGSDARTIRYVEMFLLQNELARRQLVALSELVTSNTR